ncbi:MAG: IclR family transcriptional regulator [Haloarculaceae archaeon]
MPESDTPPVESSRKLFSVLEHLVQTGGAGPTDIARRTSLPKSTVHLHLQSLLATGHAVKDGDVYRPSLELLELGERVRYGIAAYRKGRAEVDSLAEETNELVNLGVIENGKVRLVYLREVSGGGSDSSAPSVSTEFEADTSDRSVLGEDYKHTPGRTLDIHATAMGKAMLAEMSREEVEAVVDSHGLPRHTDRTITSADRLFEELETVQSRGYAEDDEERVDGLRCVAAAISDPDGPVAAVSVSALSNQWYGEYSTELANRVMNTANMIEIKLTHS